MSQITDPVLTDTTGQEIVVNLQSISMKLDALHVTASNVSYDNSLSSLDATNVQNAIDALEGISGKSPRINSSGIWEVWDASQGAYVSTGYSVMVNPPRVAATVSAMTNHDYVYIYTGSESGYQNGYWYYWNGSAWTAGGAYQVAATDKTLTVANAPADSKVTGDSLSELKSASEQVEDVLEIEKTEKTTTITSLTAGYYSANGDFHESSSYGYTPLINVLEGDVVTFKYDNGVSMRFITAYSSGAAVTSAGSNVGVTSYTVPAGIDQIRISAVLGSATPYYYTIERPKTWESAVIDSLEKNAMQKTVFLNESMVNRLNPQDAETGKLIKADGTTSTNTDYFITGYIPINGGETLYAYAPNVLNGQGIRTFAAYDKDKNVLPNLGSNSQVTSITQSGDMAYVRLTLWYSGEDTARTQYTYCVCPFVPPIPYAPRYGNTPVFESKYEREKVYIRATDTEAQIIQKFVYAFSKGDCDVIFDRATYNFTSAFATVKTTYHLNENEIPIGSGCRYYFNGSTLVATLDLSTLGDVDYYCNFFGCGRTPSSYEMYDGVLIATDTRYIVHDESSAFYGSYKHLYQNMEMHYHTNLRTETIRKCIGGGTGASGVVEIVGCKFTTDNPSDECVTFHGNSNNVVGAEFDLNIRDSWFSSGFRAGALSQDQTARIFLTGNSFSAEPYVYPEWTKTSFLNEVRS